MKTTASQRGQHCTLKTATRVSIGKIVSDVGVLDFEVRIFRMRSALPILQKLNGVSWSLVTSYRASRSADYKLLLSHFVVFELFKPCCLCHKSELRFTDTEFRLMLLNDVFHL